MCGIKKDLSLYQNKLINELGTINDYELAEKYKTTQRVVCLLRKRLNIPSYLSKRCKQKYECQICNKEFLRWPGEVERKDRKGLIFCSKDCQNIWQKRNQEIRKCTNCGNNVLISSKQRRDLEHSFCSRDCLYKWNRRENHPRWHGGYSSEYGRGWKEQRRLTLERDKCCKNCGREDNLDIHHIIPYQLSKSNKLDNLLALCKSCHSSIGNTYWKLENRPQYFETINSMRIK
jgi:hypothetical protein